MKKNLLSINTKLREASVKTAGFGLRPMLTCPFAGECGKYCYAQHGFYQVFKRTVRKAWDLRLRASLSPCFTARMISEISARHARGLRAVRIHTEGDFYSKRYVRSWFAIMRAVPGLRFYAYTKAVAWFKSPDQEIGEPIPENFTIVFSLGGTQDRLINTEQDRHSRVFHSIKELRHAGYVNGTKDDALAWKAQNAKIGLVYH